ncbi:MAG: GNAT family N-acetyltransferase [Candidatus Hermodarchaeota archaeon]
MNYREANLSDLKGIIKVGVDTWKTTYGGIISDDFLQGLSYKDKEQKWRQRLEDRKHGAKIFVAEIEQDGIVGFALATLEKYNPLIISVQPEKYVGELCAIYVLKDHQDKKIGTQLVKLVVRYFLKNKTKSMIVWVLKENPYQRFYEKMKGKYIGEQFIEIGGKKYIEKAYGWENIESILSIQ